MRLPATLALLLLAACTIRSGEETAAELTSPCQPEMFEDAPLTHCIADPQRHAITLDVAPPEGAPWRSFRAYAEGGETRGLVMAMNGGMFDENGEPIGYYVESGRRLKVVNQNDGPGNFHLLPNGVFFGRPDGSWKVLDTERFLREEKERPSFATQSGPMLVIAGELHPDIDPDGSSRKIRNAVGVDLQGRAHFVISEAPISFGKLARYYRDVLKVRNALFLDGSVSQLWDPANGRMDSGPPIGPLIVVQNKAKAGR